MTKENIVTKDVQVSVNIENARKALKIAGFPTKDLTDTQIFDKVLGMLGVYGGSATTKEPEQNLNKNNAEKDAPVSLNEKEIRVIKVALWKHWLNIVDDNGDAHQKEIQPFADCCYEIYRTFESLDDEKKKFDELDKKCPFDKITLERKSVIKESTPRKDKLFEEMLYYKVGNETTTMYAYIDDKGRASAYNEDNDCYRSSTGYYKIRIPEPVLNKLISLALHQVVEDYKLSLVAKDYKSFLNENQKTEDN